MNKAKIKGWIVPIVASLCSIAFHFIATTPTIDTYISGFIQGEAVSYVKLLIELLDYIIFVVPLGIQSVCSANKATMYLKLRERFGDDQIAVVAATLREKGFIEGSDNDINIRIFKKRCNRLVLEDKLETGASKIHGKLSFSIKKKEGLCVQSLIKGYSMLEIEDASRNEYNLTSRQKVLAGDLKFIVAVPICADVNGAVNHVVCFDSFKKIAKSGCEQGIIKICEEHAYYLMSVINEEG